MDTDTGAFLVPVSGLYAFSFSAVSSLDHTDIWIGLYKNDELQFYFGIEKLDGSNNHDNISYSWLMSLVLNDKIYLKTVSDYSGLVVDDTSFVWFNGQLLKSQ